MFATHESALFSLLEAVHLLLLLQWSTVLWTHRTWKILTFGILCDTDCLFSCPRRTGFHVDCPVSTSIQTHALRHLSSYTQQNKTCIYLEWPNATQFLWVCVQQNLKAKIGSSGFDFLFPHSVKITNTPFQGICSNQGHYWPPNQLILWHCWVLM